MSRHCKVCDVVIDPRRIAILPDTQTCTQHSTAEKKVAMVVQMGEGDHTWTETYAVDREVYDKIQEAEKNFRKTTTPKKPKVKSPEEEEELSVLDDLEEEETESSEDEYTDDEDDYSSDDYTEDED
jgi:hypothetical protein